MRFIMTSRRDETTPAKPEKAEDFDPAVFTAYMKYNEDLHAAGVLVASEGLLPGTPGARVGVSGGRRKAIDGPFAESKELVGGFYIIDVPTLEDAKAWAMRCPVGMGAADVLEIRQLTGAEDIPAPFLEMAKKAAPTWTASITKARAKP
jgi:hypothetical protein